jgi:hypothetical protein
MWRPDERVEEDVSAPIGIDPPGKRRRSRRRAWRDGLADQTVVLGVEDVRSYRVFERALVGSVDPRSALELALVHRLASLLWRLRRASAIETGLFEIQARRQDLSRGPLNESSMQPITTPINGHGKVFRSNGRHDLQESDQKPLPTSMRVPLERCLKSRAIAQCFLRLSNLDPTLLDRVGRYEARLWRHAAQTIWTLDAMRRPQPTPTRRPFRNPVARFYWDAER